MMLIDAQEQAILFPFFAVMSFVFGACCGSFFNVCVYRIPAKKSLLWPPSHCYTCGAMLKWYDNLPIIGWPLLGGRCRYCGVPYSVRYCLIEFLTGVLYLLAFWVFGPSVMLFFVWIFLGLLIIGTFTDFDHFIIPNRVNFGGLGVGLIGAAVIGHEWPAAQATQSLMDNVNYLVFGSLEAAPWWHLSGWADGLLSALFGAASGWLVLWLVSVLGRLLFQKEAMGFGDVKLMAFLGAFLGVQGCFQTVGLASMLGAVVSVSMIVWHRMFGKDEVLTMTLDPNLLPATDQSPENMEVGPVEVKIPLRTAGQMHYLPFGPYLAMAAVVLLVGHRQVAQLLDWWLRP